MIVTPIGAGFMTDLLFDRRALVREGQQERADL
jgi:hypothetical protein